MKRLLTILLCFTMLFTVGCGGDDNKNLKTEDLDEATLQGMAKDITKNLSAKEKIGQLFMVSLYSLDRSGTKNQEKVTSKMKKTLDKYPVGGVVLFSKNIETPKQTKKLINGLQGASHIPMLVAVDEEGGDVSRVASNDKMGATKYPSAKTIGASYSDDDIAKMGQTQGKELKALGINMNLAPVADVLDNSENTEVGDRSFGSDASKVSDIVDSLVKNMQKQQISATLKHFPGSGDAWGDTHRGSVETDQTIKELRRNDFKPFESGIDANVDAIMVSHMMLANVTEKKEPSSLNHLVVSDILRDELEYDGLILTDAMNMKAITDNYSSGEAAVKAIEAGVDLVVMPDNLGQAYRAVRKAIKSGRLKESQIDEAVQRILYTKIKRGTIAPDTELLNE